MRSGGYIASSPEIGIINLICLEMSKEYGLLTQATGMSADAKAANFQAGSEGGMTALTAALAGADSLISAGGLNGVQDCSLAKYVLDHDQIGALRRYTREDPVDETTALMDDIMEVGIGGHFLGRRSTRSNARTEVWRPRVFQHGTSEEFRDRPLVSDAVARAREVLAGHDVPPLADDVERHIEAVISDWAKTA